MKKWKPKKGAVKIIRNFMRIDPTRTGPLRHRFVQDIIRRWIWLEKQVWKLVVKENAFGLKEKPTQPVKNTLTRNAGRFEFHTDAKKIPAFKDWLKGQVDRGVLTTDHKGEPWTSKYIGSAYKEGINRAFLEARPSLGAPTDFYKGSQAQFLQSSFGRPERVSKLQLLATRSYEELRGITDQMSQQMGRELANGIANGLSPIEVGRGMTKRISGLSRARAEMIARTEIVNAHAEGTLDGLEDLGVDSVTAQVEFSTSGDGLVCPECDALNGKAYTIDDARGVIPVHPSCRCAWIPAVDVDDEDEKKPTSKPVKAAPVKSDESSKRDASDLEEELDQDDEDRGDFEF